MKESKRMKQGKRKKDNAKEIFKKGRKKENIEGRKRRNRKREEKERH